MNGKHIILRIANRNFRKNRTRNFLVIISIVLTCMLFTSLITIVSGMIESESRAEMRQAGTIAHATIQNLTDNMFEMLKKQSSVKEIGYSLFLSDYVDNEPLRSRRTEFWYMDKTARKLRFCEPTHGKKPEKENEVIADTKTLKLLGVPLKEGENLKLVLNIKGKQVERDFVLSGWWESDPVFTVGIIVTSENYIDVHKEELKDTLKQNGSFIGTIAADIMFPNNVNLNHKLNSLIKKSGYGKGKDAREYMVGNINPAYNTTNFRIDIRMILFLGGMLFFIGTAGYLIIYNVFQIYVEKEIRFYGLLKTTGTISRQIRKIIHIQAIYLCCFGIPLGLLFGYMVGQKLVPKIFYRIYTSYNGTQISVSPNAWIGIISTLFALITVWISIRKPGKIASKVSSVDAIKYTEKGLKGEGSRKTKKGSKIWNMALANLGRNKKKTVMTILSMSLCFVMVNTIYTMGKGLNFEEYVEDKLDTSFLIAHTDYFNMSYCLSANPLSEKFISALKKQEGFQKGGRLYYGGRFYFVKGKIEKEKLKDIDEPGKKGEYYANVYGLEEEPLERLELLEGEKDMEKLKTGKYVLLGVILDKEGKVVSGYPYEVGEAITVLKTVLDSKGNNVGYVSHEYTVLGRVVMNFFTNTAGTAGNFNLYLPAEEFKKIEDNPNLMSYACDFDNVHVAEADRFIQDYIKNTDPSMGYQSQLLYKQEFSSTYHMIVTIGGALALIIGLIGLANFVTTVFSTVQSRLKEFAILESIGMLKKQLRRMLIAEGVIYALFTTGISAVFSAAASFGVSKCFGKIISYYEYHFTLWTFMVTVPALLVVSVLVPFLSGSMAHRQSVVERLRNIE